MFCANCGTEIKVTNQRFCHNCGTEIRSVPETHQIISKKPQNVPITTGHPIKEYIRSVYNRQEQFDEDNRPSKYSIKCFIFALISIGILIFGILFSSPIILFIFSGRATKTTILVIIVITIVIDIVGLTFGILSRVYSMKAEKFEIEHTIKKLGSVGGILGIVFNAIAMVWLIILLPFIIY